MYWESFLLLDRMSEKPMNWKPLPDGTRVKHGEKGYEGWVDGLSGLHKGGKVNPDGKSKYRIRVHGHQMRELAAESEIDVCNDVDSMFRSETSLLQKRIDKRSKDKSENERLREWDAILPLPCTIWALKEYHPERDQRGGYVASRGDHTKHILNLKKRALPSSVDYFVDQLDRILTQGFPICMVPSSYPGTSGGIVDVIHRLAQNDRINASSLLTRHQAVVPSQSAKYYIHLTQQAKKAGLGIEHLSRGMGYPIDAPRDDIHRHLNTIKIVDSPSIRSRVVLLLDDIVTTGTSFMACRKLLLDAGASDVLCLALGVTTKVKGGTDL